MPATTRRSRTWSTVVALAAVVLAVAGCGPHASVRHLASDARTVVADGGVGISEASRAPEMRHQASSHSAPQQVDLMASSALVVQPPVSHPASSAAHWFTSVTPAAVAVPRGRAPPAA